MKNSKQDIIELINKIVKMIEENIEPSEIEKQKQRLDELLSEYLKDL